MKYPSLPVALLCASLATAHHSAKAAASEKEFSQHDDIVIAEATPEKTVRVEVYRHQGHVPPAPGVPAIPPIPPIPPLPDLSALENFGSFSLATGKVIKNAPYAAEVINERKQVLADGNSIEKRNSTMTWRDSAGRTRQETRDQQGNVISIRINDPVEDVQYVLNPAAKTASKVNIKRILSDARVDIEKARADVGQAKVELDKAAKEMEAANKELSRHIEVVTRKVDLSGDTAEGGGKPAKRDVRININGNWVGKGEPGEAEFFGNFGSGLDNMFVEFHNAKWSVKSSTKELGVKDIAGVRAEGKLSSYTIPAGEIGNKNPITVSTETWTSPDLQITLLSKRTDPRTGETVYRLDNVKRGEQPISLFTVPADYKMQEQRGFSFRTGKEK